MSKFIELHYLIGRPLFINIDMIKYFSYNTDKTCCIVFNDGCLDVLESYDEIKKEIEK